MKTNNFYQKQNKILYFKNKTVNENYNKVLMCKKNLLLLSTHSRASVKMLLPEDCNLMECLRTEFCRFKAHM